MCKEFRTWKNWIVFPEIFFLNYIYLNSSKYGPIFWDIEWWLSQYLFCFVFTFQKQIEKQMIDQAKTRHEPDEWIKTELQQKLAWHADYTCVSLLTEFLKNSLACCLATLLFFLFCEADLVFVARKNIFSRSKIKEYE